MIKLHDIVAGVRAGQMRALAKAITLVESRSPEHSLAATTLLDELLPATGNALRIGISGVPGAGKSTFIEAFGLFLTARGHRVAVLAVDPSSQRSGGSILGDKTRMEALARDPNAFIRPSPSGDTLGGVARKTRETLLICEAAGYDVILVETVGVGQSEVAVAGMVDFFLLLQIPGAGDELQGIKRGIMELADAIFINKAEGENRPRAELARQQYANALHLMTPRSPGWEVPVLLGSALQGEGSAAVWDTVSRFRDLLSASGEFDARRSRQASDWMWTLVLDDLKSLFLHDRQVAALLPQVQEAVATGLTTPGAAARRLLEAFKRH